MIENINVINDVLHFTANNILFEIYLKDMNNFCSIHIYFGTKNLTGGRKKMTSAILYELKQQPIAMNFLKNRCHDAITKAYSDIKFDKKNNIWTNSINSYFLGGNITFAIATIIEKTLDEQFAYIDEFIDTIYVNSKTGYKSWE